MLPIIMRNVHFCRSNMADGCFIMGFCRTLLGSSLFMHSTPLDRVKAHPVTTENVWS